MNILSNFKIAQKIISQKCIQAHQTNRLCMKIAGIQKLSRFVAEYTLFHSYQEAAALFSLPKGRQV